jgi:hypothetical protein
MKPGDPDVVVDGGWVCTTSTQAEIPWPGLNQGGNEYLSMTLPDFSFPISCNLTAQPWNPTMGVCAEGGTENGRKQGPASLSSLLLVWATHPAPKSRKLGRPPSPPTTTPPNGVARVVVVFQGPPPPPSVSLSLAHLHCVPSCTVLAPAPTYLASHFPFLAGEFHSTAKALSGCLL